MCSSVTSWVYHSVTYYLNDGDGNDDDIDDDSDYDDDKGGGDDKLIPSPTSPDHI